MTLLLMSTGGGSWVSQTAEMPCGSGVNPVDGYLVYRSASASGPWNLIGSGATITEFFDSSEPNSGEALFYVVNSIKNGINEGDSPPDA
jgi:hypothetical protein